MAPIDAKLLLTLADEAALISSAAGDLFWLVTRCGERTRIGTQQAVQIWLRYQEIGDGRRLRVSDFHGFATGSATQALEVLPRPTRTPGRSVAQALAGPAAPVVGPPPGPSVPPGGQRPAGWSTRGIQFANDPEGEALEKDFIHRLGLLYETLEEALAAERRGKGGR